MMDDAHVRNGFAVRTLDQAARAFDTSVDTIRRVEGRALAKLRASDTCRELAWECFGLEDDRQCSERL